MFPTEDEASLANYIMWAIQQRDDWPSMPDHTVEEGHPKWRVQMDYVIAYAISDAWERRLDLCDIAKDDFHDVTTRYVS
jgi:hypothetical protein